ncbi:MAG TPA: hypothetical protein VGK84_11580, partial [Candidatus Tumulicola sp.]
MRFLGAIAAIAGAAVMFAAIDLAAFYAQLYGPLLDPSSSTGAFQGALAGLRSMPPSPATDVLVLGDSRIYSGLE